MDLAVLREIFEGMLDVRANALEVEEAEGDEAGQDDYDGAVFGSGVAPSSMLLAHEAALQAEMDDKTKEQKEEGGEKKEDEEEEEEGGEEEE